MIGEIVEEGLPAEWFSIFGEKNQMNGFSDFQKMFFVIV